MTLTDRALRSAGDAAGMSLEQARRQFPPIWTIYERPLDIPHAIVVRCCYGLVPDPETFLTGADEPNGLQRARAYCRSRGASVKLPRQEADSPSIVESWI